MTWSPQIPVTAYEHAEVRHLNGRRVVHKPPARRFGWLACHLFGHAEMQHWYDRVWPVFFGGARCLRCGKEAERSYFGSVFCDYTPDDEGAIQANLVSGAMFTVMHG